jgi:hypothetical protein
VTTSRAPNEPGGDGTAHFTPLLDDELESRPDPAGDYADAMAKADALLAAVGP